MVEATDTKKTPCDYQFELLNVDGSIYRVPVLNQGSMGKILQTPVGDRGFNRGAAA